MKFVAEDDGAFCGNKIVEEGEECDCGYDDKECTELCCYPKEVGRYISLGEPARPCHLRGQYKCRSGFLLHSKYFICVMSISTIQ